MAATPYQHGEAGDVPGMNRVFRRGEPSMFRLCSGYLPPIFRLGNQVNVDDCLQKF